MKTNLQMPPKSLTFRNLFRFFWREGIGLGLGADSVGRRWDYQSFECTMKLFGKGVGDSTVEAWYAGSQLPVGNNMETLARVSGTGKPKYVSAWRREFNLGIIRQETAKELLEQRAKPQVQMPEPTPKPFVSDLKVCGDTCFNEATKTCLESVTRFPRRTKMIYVSFQLNEMPTGKMFQRKWYRNGEKFKELTDFYDGAWPGYTFLYNRWGHQSGEYAIRIFVDGQPKVASFVIE